MRIASSIVLGFFGFLFGFFGTCFCYFWAFTDHEVGYANENTLQCAPWLLGLVVLSRGIWQGRAGATRKAFWLAAAAAGAGVLGVLLKVLPWFDQHNGQIIAFTLPVLVGAALSTRWLRDAAQPTSERQAPAEDEAAEETAEETEEESEARQEEDEC
jgi:hypothetical protein